MYVRLHDEGQLCKGITFKSSINKGADLDHSAIKFMHGALQIYVTTFSNIVYVAGDHDTKQVELGEALSVTVDRHVESDGSNSFVWHHLPKPKVCSHAFICHQGVWQQSNGSMQLRVKWPLGTRIMETNRRLCNLPL